ncbi:MAG: L-serine ammonia-lyase, iron-sulfur-dependent, subunit alpha [Oscillospiraceae bacterium]|nr:L-serine ammonia-lyase, iron-sulfur-dependent, subunit alpha [Oscillospiraceae bacterium]
MLNEKIVDAYLAILKEELIPATGCTEPIAVAYAAAQMRKALGAEPDRVLAEVSGNILKNVKSVVVPNTGGMKGLKAAVAVGIVAGEADRELQVIASVPEEKHADIAAFLDKVPIQVSCPDTPHVLDIAITGWAGESCAKVRIADSHTNIVLIEKDGKVLMEKDMNEAGGGEQMTDRSVLNLADILEFANTVDTARLAPMLDVQIQYNTAIAEEGLRGNWGSNLGSLLLDTFGNDIRTEARAWAAAGSDARMSGCEMPVCIVSGSGNQGMTASLPVIRYAKHLKVSQEKLYRALAVSDLVTIHQKTGIGRLSAYCGAISAGAGAGAGIAYLLDGSYEAISHTVVNAVAMLSGTICDGAKASCASKIAAGVEAGIMGYEMYKTNNNFNGGDGILADDPEETIVNVGVLAREGMKQTDRTILEIMTKE